VPSLNVRDASAGHDRYGFRAGGLGDQLVRDPNGVVANVVGHPD
jgi:hypothetical protein